MVDRREQICCLAEWLPSDVESLSIPFSIDGRSNLYGSARVERQRRTFEGGSGMDARSFDNGRMVDPASSGRAPNLGPQGPPCCDGIRDQELLPDILGI